MREIEYRGKDIETGEWRYGYIEFNHDRSKCRIISPLRLGQYDFPHQVFEVDPETVCQFTGKTDKNKNEIYDKDILRVTSQEKTFNIVVKWSNDAMAFMACYADGKQSPFSWFSEITVYELEVIGTLDNPELLKGGEQ